MKNEFSVIKNMFSAYLNEDFDLDFVNADDAIAAFSSHASHIEIERALKELDMLLNADMNEKQLRSIIFDRFGCGYFYPADWVGGAVWLRHVESLLKK